MSDDMKRYTAREYVMAQREAFKAGVDEGRDSRLVFLVDARSKLLYPLPRVSRPRVVRDADGTEWRVFGDLQFRHFGEWRHHSRYPSGAFSRYYLPIDAEHAPLWADLFANPTETVEADD